MAIPTLLKSFPASVLAVFSTLAGAQANPPVATNLAPVTRPYLSAMQFCEESYLSLRMGQLPWRDAPAADLAAEADRACPPIVPAGASAARPDEASHAATLGRLVERIARWREGPAPLFPTGDGPRTAVPNPGTPVGDCKPEYPPQATRAGATGASTVVIDVDEQGRATDVTLVRSAGPTREHRLLDRAARETLGECRFAAAPGVPLRRTAIEYVWRLVWDSPASAPAPR